jgi:uncharacterized membrane protein YphA (DoxX/SURF4 family)
MLAPARPAAAHVKWFFREDPAQPATAIPFALTEPAVQLWLGIILACVGVALVLDRYLPPPPQGVRDFARRQRAKIVHLFQLLVGLALLLTAVKGALIAPHLAETGPMGLLLRFVEGAAGVLLIANIGVRLAAGLMIVLFLASAGLFGFISSLEYFNFLGIALFLLFEGNAARRADDRFHPYALPVLRVHAGIALGVLAWTEKLVDPNLAIRFLENHQINFMKFLGEHLFSDRLFVLCAGCTELIFAIIFTLGLITRINTLTLAGFLLSSNLYFFVIGKTEEGFLELTGHLPLVAIALLLILYGGGHRLRLTNLLFRRESEPPPP